MSNQSPEHERMKAEMDKLAREFGLEFDATKGFRAAKKTYARGDFETHLTIKLSVTKGPNARKVIEIIGKDDEAYLACWADDNSAMVFAKVIAHTYGLPVIMQQIPKSAQANDRLMELLGQIRNKGKSVAPTMIGNIPVIQLDSIEDLEKLIGKLNDTEPPQPAKPADFFQDPEVFRKSFGGNPEDPTT